MKRIPIDTAEPGQLRHYCRVVLGLEDISDNHSGATLRAKIEAVQPGATEIVVEDDPPAPVAAPQAAAPAAAPAPPPVAPQPMFYAPPQAPAEPQRTVDMKYQHDPKIEVMIATTNEQGGKRDVFVAVGGETITIRRGVWVPIPYRFYEALQNAVETVYEHEQPNPREAPIMTSRENYAHNVSSRNPPSEEVLAEWRARTGAVFAP